LGLIKGTEALVELFAFELYMAWQYRRVYAPLPQRFPSTWRHSPGRRRSSAANGTRRRR
jgi:hypothetical protein